MENYFNIRKAAARCGVRVETLRNWERRGKIRPSYTPGGHRRYTEQMLVDLLKKGLSDE
jgi:DNA-binding transcriptional MerR regulator